MTELRDKRIAIVGVGLMGGLLLDRFAEAVETARSRMDALQSKSGL